MTSVARPSDLHLAQAMAAVAIVLLAGVVLGRLARRLGQPPVIGEIAAGIVLGPSALGLMPGHLTDRLFPSDVRPLLSAISQFGLLLFLFMIGWRFERQLLQGVRSAAVTISLTCMAFAFALGVGLALVLYPHHSTPDGHLIGRTPFALFIGAAMAVTAFPVLARIISDNGLGRTRVGALALASAAVDDVLAWTLLALVSALVSAHGHVGDLVQIVVLAVAYLAIMFIIIRPLLDWFVGFMVGRKAWRSLFVVLCAGALLSSYATTWIGIHAMFGAFLFGFVTPREPARMLAAHVAAPLDHVALVLLPVFFIVTGLSVDLAGLTGRGWLEFIGILVVATAGKVLGAIVPARALGLPWSEARVLGVLMNTRGLTELIILNAALTLGVLDTQLFTMMVVMALFTTALAGPLLPRSGLLGLVAQVGPDLKSADAEESITEPVGRPSGPVTAAGR